MRIERTRNASRNVLFGIIQRIYGIVVPFLMRTVMIYYMGAQYLGLNSLFSSILQVLNLAELGVGSAMVYSMYKPIAEDDTKTICALMKLYRRYYRIIGFVILVLGGFVTPFVPELIKTDTIPEDINIYVLYILNLASVVISYWLFAYKNCLLSAYQRNDVSSKISMIISTATYILQFAVIFSTHNFYLYTFVILLSHAINNIVTAIIVNKMYPDYHPIGELSKEETKVISNRIRDLFTAKIGSVVYDSADTIVISAFLGLTILAIYQNYFYILSSVTGFISILFSSSLAGIGNSLIVETKEKNFGDLKKFTFIICWLGGFCSTGFLCLYQPFMELWVGKDLMFDDLAVVCFVLYFYIKTINTLLNVYKDASGMWHEDRLRPLVASLVNLALNLILVQFCGIYGVLISTVLAILCVGIPWLLKNLFTVVFDKADMKCYLKKLLLYTLIVFATAILTYFICNIIHLNLLYTLLIRMIICITLPNICYFILYRKTSEFKDMIILVEGVTKIKLPAFLKKY